MKKCVSIILAVTLCFGLFSCGGSKPKEAAEISVYMLTQNLNTEELIKSYNEVNPDVKINIEIGIQDYYKTPSDAKKELNTRLMAGDGPDIIIMDDMNAESYYEAGRLEPLSGVISEADEIPENIKEAFKNNGDIFYFPMAICLCVNANRPGTEVNNESLAGFVSDIKSNGLNIQSLSFDNLAALWYRTTLEPDIKKNNGIKEMELKAFYENLSDLMKSYNGAIEFASFQQLNMQVNQLSQFKNIYYKRADISKDYVNNIIDLQMLYNLSRSGELEFDYAEKNNEKLYIPQCIMAVNKDSNNMDEAKKMISYFLSDDGQKNAADNFMIPVNLDVMKAEINNEDSYIVNDEFKITPLTKDEQEKIIALIDSVNYPMTADSHLMEIIMGGAQDFLNGEASLDDAIKRTMKKIGIYLSE